MIEIVQSPSIKTKEPSYKYYKDADMTSIEILGKLFQNDWSIWYGDVKSKNPCGQSVEVCLIPCLLKLLKENEEKHCIGSKANKSRSPAFEKECYAFITEGSNQNLGNRGIG